MEERIAGEENAGPDNSRTNSRGRNAELENE